MTSPCYVTKSKAKTAEQGAAQRRKKRWATVLNKSAQIKRDCGVDIFLIIEEPTGEIFKFQTKGDESWPSAALLASATDLEDPIPRPRATKLREATPLLNMESAVRRSIVSTSPEPMMFRIEDILQPPTLMKSPQDTRNRFQGFP